MAPYITNGATAIHHFTHPAHPLVQHNMMDFEFTCDGCKTLGKGTTFRCNPCDFDLHEYCATCPSTLTSSVHPPHSLSLLVRSPVGTRTNIRPCNVCGDSVEGLFYWCKICDFNVHPLCTQLPQFFHHPLHPLHPLTLGTSKRTSSCVVCRGLCTFWHYSCVQCNDFDIHLECVLVTPPSPLAPPLYYGGNFNSGGGSNTNFDYMYNQYANKPSLADEMYFKYAGTGLGSSSGSGSDPYNIYNGASYGNYQVQEYNGSGSTDDNSSKKKIYNLVGKVALTLLSNGMFGTGSSGF